MNFGLTVPATTLYVLPGQVLAGSTLTMSNKRVITANANGTF